MKKAKIILAGVMLLAVLGGVFAFKAARTSLGKLFYSTNAYAANNTIYTRAGLATFCVPDPVTYWTTTPNPGGFVTSYITTAHTTTVITLTRVGVPTEQITIPSYTCVTTSLYTTAAF